MSAALDHRLVRDYLRKLDVALSGLPAGQAQELREQITAHLDDLLSPGATDVEVSAALGRLGSPAELAAEAAAESSPALRARPRRMVRARLVALGWRRGLLVLAGTLLAGVALGYYIAMQTAPELIFAGAASWWYPKDSAREVDTSADGASQTTAPIRSGQRQGFAITLINNSDWTQTVLGPPTGLDAAWDSPNGGPSMAQLSVSTPNRNIENGGFSTAGVKFVLPGSIPPHQIRMLRVLWTSSTCLMKGGSQGIDQLVLRVRVGWITRIETVDLGQGWYLAGPSHGRCT